MVEPDTRAILGAMLRLWTCSGLALLLCACGGGTDSAGGGEARGPAARARANAQRRGALRDELVRALGASYDEPLARVDAPERAKGSEVYERLCAGCHGRSGRGGTILARALPVEPGDHLVRPVRRCPTAPFNPPTLAARSRAAGAMTPARARHVHARAPVHWFALWTTAAWCALSMMTL